MKFKAPFKSGKSKDEPEMSFLEHLEVLRWHLIRSIVAILIVGVGVFVTKDFIFNNIVLAPREPGFITYRIICRFGEKLCFTPPPMDVFTRELGEQFMTHIKVSIWLGLVVAFPYVFYEIWRFVKPGLYEKEQKAAKGVVFVCSMLFLMGVAFGYFVISPFAVSFLSSYAIASGIENTVQLSSFVNYMVMFTLPTGLIFELPIVVYFLAKVGLIYPEFMRRYRKHSFVIILVLAALITPPDVITQLLIAAPLYFLYEVSIVIAARVAKANEKAMKNA